MDLAANIRGVRYRFDLDHPGIARLIDGGETEEGVPWLVTEYVDGERIDRWCELHHTDFATRVRLAIAVGEALGAAHAALIVHRDLKPANILVDRNGRPRLLDFGIAKAIDARGLQHTIQQTAVDQRLMTLRYASPEQVRGGAIGTTSDQYSLAVVLYELVAGQSPYGEVDTSSIDLMKAICEHDPAPPSRVARGHAATGRTLERARRGFGSDLDAILRKALRMAPGERYPSIGAFLDRGDFEKRLKALLVKLKQDVNAILFIDEIHTLIGAGAASGGVMDAANLIKPLLANRELKCMGSTTYQEYRGTFEKDRALARRFQKIDVPEPTVEETVEILRGLRGRLEAHHKVKYRLSALRASAELAARYLPDRFLPDKAIDIIDEAGAYQALRPANKRKDVIGVAQIEAIVAKMARIPARNISATDKDRLRTLEHDLKMRVFGQNLAIENLATAIKLARSGLREANKTIGSFLLAGPTGVGKTLYL